MAYDLRTNPDPSIIRTQTWYAVDGRDAADGAVTRALFQAGSLNEAVAACQTNGLIGELFEVPSASLLDWQRWADSLLPTPGVLTLPRPESGVLLGTLEAERSVSPRLPHRHFGHRAPRRA